MNIKRIDQRAQELSQKFKKCEADLLEIIMKVDEFKVYRKFNFPSLFQYVVGRLNLSEAQAYNFINVARKSKEVPQLKERIANGNLTISKAKKITSVITFENQDHWLNLAERSTQKKVEREVALANPSTAIAEKMTYVSQEETVREKVQVKKNTPKVRLEMGLSEKLMLKIRRAQDLISQKRRGTANLEICFDVIVDEYLRKHDPVEKAKRQKVKGKLNIEDIREEALDQPNEVQVSRPVGKGQRKRQPLPASVKHQVYLNSEGRCTVTDERGRRCRSTRFLEIHHIKPLSQGGGDDIENLTLVCSGHHRAIHHRKEEINSIF